MEQFSTSVDALHVLADADGSRAQALGKLSGVFTSWAPGRLLRVGPAGAGGLETPGLGRVLRVAYHRCDDVPLLARVFAGSGPGDVIVTFETAVEPDQVFDFLHDLEVVLLDLQLEQHAEHHVVMGRTEGGER